MKHLFSLEQRPKTIEELNEMQLRDLQREANQQEFYSTAMTVILATIFCIGFLLTVNYMAKELVQFNQNVSRSFN